MALEAAFYNVKWYVCIWSGGRRNDFAEYCLHHNNVSKVSAVLDVVPTSLLVVGIATPLMLMSWLQYQSSLE